MGMFLRDAFVHSGLPAQNVWVAAALERFLPGPLRRSLGVGAAAVQPSVAAVYAQSHEVRFVQVMPASNADVVRAIMSQGRD